MNYLVSESRIEVYGKEDFNIEHILECGQIFSYVKGEDRYTVYSADKKAEIFEFENGFLIRTFYPLYFEKFFDLGRNYGEIKRELSKHKIMQEPIKFGSGIRILRQNPFETLISFIISANNNIERIKKILFGIRERFGKKTLGYRAFPTRDELLKATEKDFEEVGAGYRAKYLFNVLRQVDEKTLEEWGTLSTEELRKNLIALSGVGPKVADCVLLFGYGRGDVFPVDTWIQKIYEKFYEKCDNREKIRENLVNEFGQLSGFAQQYLFFFMRSEENLDETIEK